MAMALIVGMMVVSASAASKDFTDKDEIRHTEAVNTMVALNVISGKEDGSYFDPTGTLTRAEMAKIIAYVMNGGVEPNIGTKVVPTYSDIDNHWAEAYIEYCTSMGIINGDGAGKFNPQGTLTASQAAKMFLTAMGYNAEVFGLVGNSWETNTNRYANEAGLYDELGGVAVSQPISRDDAAQMAYNAIQATLVERTWSQNQTTGQITEGYELSRSGKTLLSERFGAKIFVGSFDGNTETLSLKDGYVQVTGALTTDDTSAKDWKDKDARFPYDLDIAQVGEEFKVIYKEGTGGTDGQPDGKDTIYGAYNTGATDVLNVTVNDITAREDYDEAGKVEIDGEEYDVVAATNDTAVAIVRNYGAKADVVVDADGTAAAITEEKPLFNSYEDAFQALASQKGDTVKFILNSDGEVEKAYLVESTLNYVSAVNNEKVSISNIGSIKIADHDIYDGVAKGDVVTVTTLYSGDNTLYVVEEAQVVSGTVTGLKDKDGKNSTITLDGTAYKVYGATDMMAPSSLGSSVTGLDAVIETNLIGETFDLYLVNGYVRAAAQTSESASNYSLIVATKEGGVAGATFNALQIQVLAADGTKTILTVDKDSDSGLKVGDIVTWTGSADEALVKRAALAKDAPTSSTDKFYDKTSKTVEGTVTAANAVLFVNEGKDEAENADFNAYSIRSLGDIDTTSKACKIIEKDGRVVAAYINLGDAPSGATSSAIYGMVVADNGAIKVDDDVYHNYTLWTTDGEKTVNVADGTLKAGTIYKYNPTSDDVYSNAGKFEAHGGKPVAIKEYDEADGLLTYYTTKSSGTAPNVVWGGETTNAVSDDVVILYVDYKNGEAGDEIGVNPYDDITDLFNALIILDEDVITHIIIETSNEADIA